MSEIVDGNYQDTWTSQVELSIDHVAEDGSGLREHTHLRTTVNMKQWDKLFIATDHLRGPWRGQGKTVEEAVLEFLKQKLTNRDIP